MSDGDVAELNAILNDAWNLHANLAQYSEKPMSFFLSSYFENLYFDKINQYFQTKTSLRLKDIHGHSGAAHEET